MLKEIEYHLESVNYLITQLPVTKAQEVLVRLLKLLGGSDAGAISLASLPARLSVSDITFLREALFGANCQYQNENGNWVPLGKAIVDNHFAGHIGLMFHLLGKCLVVNFSDFLADLRLDQLVGSNDAASLLQTSTGSSGELS